MKILKENQEENNYWRACKKARKVYKMINYECDICGTTIEPCYFKLFGEQKLV